MAITYPRSLPSALKFQAVTINANNVVGVSKSPFTGQEQVVAHQGQWWTAQCSVTPIERADAGAVSAWFTSLFGRHKTFLLGDPAAATAQGSASSAPGTPVVNGASQTGSALICDGAPNDATDYLKEGDYVQLGSGSTASLHMVMEDVTSDESGNFTLNIWPNLRSSPADDATLTVANCVGVFRLAENVASWDLSTVLYGFSFGAIESF